METIKWGAPAFTYRDKLLGVMAGFKQHAAFNLWHGKQVVGEEAAAAEGMGQYGRLATLKDLPAKRETTAHVRAAMALIEAGATAVGSRKAKPPPELPDDLAAAMRDNKAARGHWTALTRQAARVRRLDHRRQGRGHARPARGASGGDAELEVRGLLSC